MIFTLVGALILAVGVYLITSMGSSEKDVKYDQVKAGDPLLGSWSTADGSEKSESADLEFKSDKNVSGHIAGYSFKGTFKKKSDADYVIFNKNGKKAYTIVLDNDEITMDPVAATLTAHWILTAD